MKKILFSLFLLLFISMPLNAYSWTSGPRNNNECSDTNPLCNDGKLKYTKRSEFSTPFDPHKVLDTWKPLVTEVIPPGFLMVVMGNPLVNWEGVPEDLNPMLAKRPDGVKYTAVAFTFGPVRGSNNKIHLELMVMGYVDPIYGTMYTHRLRKDKSGYEALPKKERDKLLKELKAKAPNVCLKKGKGTIRYFVG